MKTMPLYKLKKIQSEFPCIKITSADVAQEFIKNFYDDDIEIFESCFILLLNRGNQTIGYAKISQGGICGTIIDTRLVAKYAVESLASGVILAHNHPGGTNSPSHSDLQITEKIKKGLDLLDIQLLDHVILTKDNYYSLADNGQV
jgi:DNA repair protein RadC